MNPQNKKKKIIRCRPIKYLKIRDFINYKDIDKIVLQS